MLQRIIHKIMRGPVKFGVVILLVVAIVVGYTYFPAWSFSSSVSTNQHSHRGHHHDRLMPDIGLRKITDNKVIHRPVRVHVDANRVGSEVRESDHKHNHDEQSLQAPVDPDQDYKENSIEEVEVANAFSKDSCKFDEDNMYKDQNIQPLYQICTMTVKNKEFIAGLRGLKRLVHLDLKGAAPKPSYLLELFPLLKEAGATGLLIEYEDMFPYSGDLAILASGDAYSVKDLKAILSAAKSHGLSVMPLVQTFGHLEFVLKHKEFMHLRELEDIPQAISPCVKGTSKLLGEMLTQVMDFHPDSKNFHIGSDEVYDLGAGRCNKTLGEPGMTKDRLFLKHVKEMAEIVRRGKKTPVMWDDMFRHTPLNVLRTVSDLVEPMIWQYTPDLLKYIPDKVFLKYSQAFPNMWVASSFKGATGSNQYVTDAFYHIRNHMAWLKVLHKYNTINFRGMALTGWQRYDHFAIVCELLPAAIPSLVLCLQAAQHGTINEKMLTSISTTFLKMKSPYTLKLQESPQPPESLECEFPGSDVYKAIMQLRDTRYFLNLFEGNHLFQGWATKYHAKYNYYSPGQLKYAQRKIPKMLSNLTEVETKMNKAMPEIFYQDTLEEWLMVNVESLRDRLNNYDKVIETAITKGPKYWPARPFHNKKIDPSVNLNFVFGNKAQGKVHSNTIGQNDFVQKSGKTFLPRNTVNSGENNPNPLNRDKGLVSGTKRPFVPIAKKVINRVAQGTLKPVSQYVGNPQAFRNQNQIDRDILIASNQAEAMRRRIVNTGHKQPNPNAGVLGTGSKTMTRTNENKNEQKLPANINENDSPNVLHQMNENKNSGAQKQPVPKKENKSPNEPKTKENPIIPDASKGGPVKKLKKKLSIKKRSLS